MSRIAEVIQADGHANGVERPMVSMIHGGQHGWTPTLSEWVNNQAYVTRPLVCILLEAPKVFQMLPNSHKWVASLKSLFELHALNIDGMNATLKVDTDERAVGGAGEVQEEFTNVTRERSQPKFTFVEKYGRPIQTFLDFWIRYGMMDPETKFALLDVLQDQTNTQALDLLADWYSCSCLFFVPDPLHRKIDKAWITTNMFPKGTGDITAKRDLTTGQEILNLDIEFTGLSQFGIGVNAFAQTILNAINSTSADPYMKRAFINSVSADVLAATKGYKQRVEYTGTESVSNMNEAADLTAQKVKTLVTAPPADVIQTISTRVGDNYGYSASAQPEVTATLT